MHCCRKIRYFLALCLLLVTLPVMADGVRPLKSDGIKMPNGEVLVATRFFIDLPQPLQEVLKQGIPLQFDLSYQITRPASLAYKFRFNQLFSDDNTLSYKLSYHPVTNRYRVATGTFYTEYPTLDTALRALGATANWQILPQGSLNAYSAYDTQISVKLTLNEQRLPKPYQVNAADKSKRWKLDSGWVRLNIIGE